jgi:hypothetical protein
MGRPDQSRSFRSVHGACSAACTLNARTDALTKTRPQPRN